MDAKQIAALPELNAMGSSISDLVPIVRIGLYSDPGIGKTTISALIADVISTKSCIITTDKNYAVINKFPDVAAKITRYPFTGMSQIKTIVEAHDEGVEPYSLYDTIILDTYSTMIDMYVRHAVKTKKFNDQRDKDVASWTHYGLAANAAKDNIFDPLKSSNLNAIFLTHVRDPTEKDLQKKRFYIRSNLPDASWQPLIQDVQAMAWLYREEKGSKVLAQFEPTISVMAKSQIPTIDQTTYLAEEIPDLISKWVKS